MRRAKGGFSRNSLGKRTKKRPKAELVRALADLIPIDETIVDIGCGVGQYVRAFQELGYKVVGLDGGEDVEEITGGLVKFCDLTSDTIPYSAEDWGLFLDVGEHIPKAFEDEVFRNVSLLAKKGLIVTWGKPGQRGNGHVNNRKPEYVAARFREWDWLVDDEETSRLRNRLTRPYFTKRIMVLRPA